MTSIMEWIDTVIVFPQLSFLKPVMACAILLIAVDLVYHFVFSFFKRFFE